MNTSIQDTQSVQTTNVLIPPKRRAEPQFSSRELIKENANQQAFVPREEKEKNIPSQSMHESLQKSVILSSEKWNGTSGINEGKVERAFSKYIVSEMFLDHKEPAKESDLQVLADAVQEEMAVVSEIPSVKENNAEGIQTKQEDDKQTIDINPGESIASVLLSAFPQVGSDDVSIPSKGRILYSFIFSNYEKLEDQYKQISKQLVTKEQLHHLYKETLRENHDALYSLIDIVNDSGVVSGDKNVTVQIPHPRDMLDVDSQVVHNATKTSEQRSEAKSGLENAQGKKSFWGGLFRGA